jgi:CBS domain containing-hemolysin-like protein
MPTTLPVLFWVVGGSLAISFMCSILEAVLLSVSHSYVQILKERDPRAGGWLDAMLRKVDEPIAAILTLNTAAHTVGAFLAGGLALQIFGEAWVGAFSAGLTLAILLLSEILPKTIGATYWKTLARPASYVLRVMVLLMRPIIVPLSWFNRLITPSTARPTVSRAELEVLAEMGRREGALDEEEWQVVSNVIRLDEVSLGEVMTPRTDIVAVPIDSTVEAAIDVMLRAGHLRVPVYDGSLDQIAGILLGRDLWRAQRNGVQHVRDVVRPISFEPSSKPVEDLIPEMRRRRSKMAIVVDEFGGTAGLVTFEDLIEEIIGEIQDEHEADEPEDFVELEGKLTRVWGGVPLREVNERLGLDLPEDQHDTIGGYLFGRLSRVGMVGDAVEVKRGRFRITRMRGRRIEYAVFQPEEPDTGLE